MKKMLFLVPLLFSFFVYAQTEKSDLKYPKKEKMLINSFIHDCYTEGGLLITQTSSSSNKSELCKSKGLLSSPPLLKKEKSRMQKLISITCWEKDGTKKVVDTFESTATVCEENGLLNDSPVISKCTPINGEIKIENYYGDSITYTEIEYTCGNLKDGPRKKMSCKGRWVGDLEGCSKNRFSLMDWKAQVANDRLENPAKIRKEFLDDAAKGGSTR